MVTAIGKLCLRNAQTIRQLAAAVIMVHLLRVEDVTVQACVATSKNYDKTV